MTHFFQQTFKGLLSKMLDRAGENYKAEVASPNQASLHTIAYTLVKQELHSWQQPQLLERIAQALEASLRGDTTTPWQVEEQVYVWARDWARERLNIPSGQLVDMDLSSSAELDRETGEWTTSIWLAKTEEVYKIIFKEDEYLHLQFVSVELCKEA